MAPDTEREGSGVYRAFSGSVEAAGASEIEALDTLDRHLARLSSLPPGAVNQAENEPERIELATLNDTEHCPPRFHSILPPANTEAPDTIRAPRPSSLPALAFARRY